MNLRDSVTFYASFHKSPEADFGGGELKLATRTNHPTEAGQFVVTPGFDENVFRIAKKGVQGGALAPADVLANNGRIFFPAKGNIAFQKGGWSGACSFWLNTNPNTLLKTKFCDPVQITEKGAGNGGIWFDFNDASPRDGRMGVFPAVPAGGQPIKESDPDAPLIPVRAIGFQEGEWHHVVLNWKNFDTGRPDAWAGLYIDGKPVGEVKDRPIAMDWNLDKAGIYVAVNYLGLLDELAIFGRTLTPDEIDELYRKPGLLTPLRK